MTESERTKGEKQRHSTYQGLCLSGTAPGETAKPQFLNHKEECR